MFLGAVLVGSFCGYVGAALALAFGLTLWQAGGILIVFGQGVTMLSLLSPSLMVNQLSFRDPLG